MNDKTITIAYAYKATLPNEGRISVENTDTILNKYVAEATWGEMSTEELQSNEVLCDALYYAQGNNPYGNKINDRFYSLSKGDLITINDETYICSSIGWTKLTAEQLAGWNNASELDRLFPIGATL